MAYPPPPYQDAVAGQFVAGEALVGTWWAYPPAAGLGLGAVPPEISISVPYVPPAGLGLGAVVPTTRMVYSVPEAGLGLGTVAPALLISTYLFPPIAGLGLGSFSPDYIGPLFLHPADCVPLVLPSSPETELVLVGATASEITLDPVECL